VGYILAVVIPLVGFILGIVVVTRSEKAVSKHGPFIIVVSVVAFIVYVALITAASRATVTTG
jgi:hypothetical protein